MKYYPLFAVTLTDVDSKFSVVVSEQAKQRPRLFLGLQKHACKPLPLIAMQNSPNYVKEIC